MRYQPDRNGLAGLLKSKTLQDLCVSRAEQGARWVRSVAPRDTGSYIAGIRVTRSVSARDGRVMANLEATARHSAAVEFGTKRTKARHLLRSAIAIIEGDGG